LFVALTPKLRFLGKGDSINMWEGPHSALNIDTKELATAMGVTPGQKVITIHPGETILAHTQEFIGGRGTVTTMLKTRSSLGRCLVNVCKCAGWGDIGFVSRWTLEIQNSGQLPVVLPVGARIGQIIFFRSSHPVDSYEVHGSYQKASPYDMAAVKAKWTPTDMLPKLDKL
jgi:dCTP deaminase